MLPMPGKVLVNPGDRVQPAQPVAQTEVSGEVSVVNVAQLLRVAPARAYKYIKVREGADVTMNTVIASKGLTAAGRVKSPANGFVYRIDKSTGRVLIKVVSRPLELMAYLAGTVSSVMAGRGVVVETTGALIQAALGIGGESYGVLQWFKRATDPMSTLIDVTMQRSCGRRLVRETVNKAIQMQVRGLVAGRLTVGCWGACAPFDLDRGSGSSPWRQSSLLKK
jgi:hypothetical protein